MGLKGVTSLGVTQTFPKRIGFQRKTWQTPRKPEARALGKLRYSYAILWKLRDPSASRGFSKEKRGQGRGRDTPNILRILYIYTHIYAHIHTYIQPYTHTYIQPCSHTYLSVLPACLFCLVSESPSEALAALPSFRNTSLRYVTQHAMHFP